MVLVSIFLLLFYFLADLSGEVQAKYKWQIKNEIIARCLCSSIRQPVFPDNFFLKLKTSIISFFNRTNSYFFWKNIKERHLNCKLVIKIPKLSFLPSIKKLKILIWHPLHNICNYYTTFCQANTFKIPSKIYFRTTCL